MVDVFSKRKRSAVMAAIRSSGNRDTEISLARIFRKHGVKGWRRHLPLPGKPDFVFRRECIAVFVDGCFWHGCPRHLRAPKSNKAYWRRKIATNRMRDAHVKRVLQQGGWHVLRIWEHELKNELKLVRRVHRVLDSKAKQS
ncbi:MAG TPA: very short patch repair endonuclease [Verrucomicrobiae bacterium]|nr:very short patch repair endonuclease [Verrucomicrobiae bacterium]